MPSTEGGSEVVTLTRRAVGDEGDEPDEETESARASVGVGFDMASRVCQW